MPEQEIGTVIHYFAGPGAAVVRLTGEITVGDKLRFLGHTTDFTETVSSMEVDHKKVERATAGEEVAIQVLAPTRPHDRVLKVV